jgi:hypothetical protein
MRTTPYRPAVVGMFNRFTPLPIAKESGDAVAGRLIVIPIA